MNLKTLYDKAKRNKKRIAKSIIIIIFTIVISPIAYLGAWIVYMDLRPAPNYVYDPMLQLTHWTVVDTGGNPAKNHNSNTDLIYFNNSFYLVFQQSKWHIQDTNGVLVIQKSPDATPGSWEEIHRITLPNTDVRDPKFANISDRLFVYFLPNYRFDPAPNTTFYLYSDDGLTFTSPQELQVNVTYTYDNGTIENVKTAGWNLWRPKTYNNADWYVLASGRKYKQDPGSVGDADVTGTMTILLETQDGLNWTEVSEVYTTHGNGEACLEFLTSGKVITTHRVGSMGLPGYAFGNPHGATVIGTSYNNLQNWSFAVEFQTRLDGATLFKLDGRIFAVGRNHLGPRPDMGNHFAVKRTAFYEVKSDRLIHLFDLPSNGDTAYTGVAIKDGWVYASYYTNPINKNYAWFVGQIFLTKSNIRMVKVNATGLLTFADMKGGG
ncbi:MAG: hypothetical protein ACFFA8_07850 [Promethearchaeota archaeon]